MVLLPPPSASKARKHLSADALYTLVREGFAKIPDHRDPRSGIPLADALMSAFAMFSLKDPSLPAFDQRRSDANLKALFGIGQIPSDTQTREILDPLDPERPRDSFGDVFRQLQRGKALEPFAFYAGHYLLSLDGTGYFSSQKVHCPSCQVKEHKDGTVTYQHPHLKLIVVEDGLASNGPRVRDLIDSGMHFILGVKPGDHAFLFEQVEAARRAGRSPKLSRKEGDGTVEVSWVHGVPLNESNPDSCVDFLEYNEYDADGKRRKHFTWITDLHVKLRNAWKFARGGRARWRIENETFNTLKNQGYHYEHNYGHGPRNLSVVFAMLMMLAFLVDRAQQLCCPLFRAVWRKLGSKRALWEKLRSHFYHSLFRSMRHLYEVMLHDLGKEVPVPAWNSS